MQQSCNSKKKRNGNCILIRVRVLSVFSEAAERRQALLVQILEPEAKERLSRISLVKPEKARKIEDMILAQASSGRLGGKVRILPFFLKECLDFLDF